VDVEEREEMMEVEDSMGKEVAVASVLVVSMEEVREEMGEDRAGVVLGCSIWLVELVSVVAEVDEVSVAKVDEVSDVTVEELPVAEGVKEAPELLAVVDSSGVDELLDKVDDAVADGVEKDSLSVVEGDGVTELA
jgi:hypothetical protein